MSRGALAAWCAVGVAGLAALVLLTVVELPPGPRGSLCLLRRTTGIPCPGCGMTRAAAALARGDLAAAFAHHPLAPLVALEGVVLWLAAGGILARGGRLALPRHAEGWAWVHLVALLALWLGRAATGTLPW